MNTKPTRSFADGRPVAFMTFDKSAEVAVAPTRTEVPPASSANAPRTFKLVSLEDVRNTPAKWQGRDIQFARVQVYWVGDDDVRFLTKSSLTLFGSGVRGDPKGVAFLKENCETSCEADMAKCTVTVKFSYKRHGEDSPNGLMKRTILVSDDIEIARPGRR